ncbi:germination protein YpeB [Desulfitibacter alkalitolerans]|uniref:germination protein YpeB n=1 Tax=Desulfitibacter alkalitolerans TaxID=264641 RepID=UPI000488BDFB|nr:germination protein YpeB [Desulfitibacter alkalitolerans]
MKNWWHPLTVVLLTAALISTAYWGNMQQKEKHKLIIMQETHYQRAYYDLTGSMQMVENALSKALASGTRDYEQLQLTLAWQQAHMAQRDLAQLPLGRNVLIQTQKFLNQLGDYCFTLANGYRQEIMEDNDRKQIQRLHGQALDISQQLHRLHIDISGDRFPWSSIAMAKHRDWSQATRSLPEESFANLEEQIQTFPQLIYDGPFSEQVIDRTVEIPGKFITREDAKAIAGNFLGIEEKRVSYRVSESDEKAPVQVFSVRVIPVQGSIGDQIVLDITKAGGHVAWMLNNRSVGGSDLTLEDAQEKAEQFLEARGYVSFKATGVLRTFNQAVVSFGEERDGILIYPHLIKVKVALDSGQVTGFEAINYLIAKQQERSWPEEGLSGTEAQARLNPNFHVEKLQKVVIPLPTGQEAYCWEFKGSLGHMPFLIYIDAKTGRELNILRYVESDFGLITM